MRLRRIKLNSIDAVEVFKALASATRVDILRALAESPRNVSALSEMMGISQSATTKHIQQLESAGLIQFEHRPGAQGTQKLCSLRYDMLNLFFNSKNLPRMGVGDAAQHGHGVTVEVAGMRILPEEAEGRIHAMDVDTPAQVMFINNTDIPFERLWLDQHGKRQSYGHVMPGSIVSQATWSKHAWLLVSPDQNVLGIFVVREAVGCIIISGPRNPLPSEHPGPRQAVAEADGQDADRSGASTLPRRAQRSDAETATSASASKVEPVGASKG